MRNLLYFSAGMNLGALTSNVAHRDWGYALLDALFLIVCLGCFLLVNKYGV